MPINDAKNTNCINKGRDLRLANKLMIVSPMYRKDVTKDSEIMESYSTLIGTSSTRARRDGKI